MKQNIGYQIGVTTQTGNKVRELSETAASRHLLVSWGSGVEEGGPPNSKSAEQVWQKQSMQQCIPLPTLIAAGAADTTELHDWFAGSWRKKLSSLLLHGLL